MSYLSGHNILANSNVCVFYQKKNLFLGGGGGFNAGFFVPLAKTVFEAATNRIRSRL